MVAMLEIFSSTAIANAMASVQAPNTFYYIPFFATLGLGSKTPEEQVRKVFNLLDTDSNHGFQIRLGPEDLLQNFQPGARKLTPSETAAFMKAADPDNTGKITYAGFEAMVRSVKD